MKKISFSLFLFLVLTTCSFLSYAWNPFKKQTYEDCILENMKGVKSDDAAHQIKFACEIKMYSGQSSSNTKSCTNRKLTAEESKLVSGNAVVESYGYLKVHVYNGNKNITINEVKAKLIDIEAKQEFDFQLTNSVVKPISTSGEMLAKLLYAPKKWNWYLYDITTEICK